MKAKVNHANLLFVYDNVIKSPDPYILKLAQTKYKDKLKDFLYLDLPQTATIETITSRMVNRTVKNPLEWLAKKSFDYDKAYKQLKSKSMAMYEKSIYLNSYNSLRIFRKSYCIGKIYIWNESYDKRQIYDIAGLLDKSNEKIQYVTSPTLRQAIDTIGDLTVVYDWDVERVRDIVETGVYDDILFAVADYPFNFDLDNMNHLKYGLYNKENVRPFKVFDRNESDTYYG